MVMRLLYQGTRLGVGSDMWVIGSRQRICAVFAIVTLEVDEVKALIWTR